MNRSRINGVRINDSPTIVIVIVAHPLFITLTYVPEYGISVSDGTEFDITISDNAEYNITIGD